MTKTAAIIITLITFFFGSAATGVPARDKPPADMIWGQLASVDHEKKTLLIQPPGKKQPITISFDKNTLFFSGAAPAAQAGSADPEVMPPGVRVVAITSAEGAHINALQVWSHRAYLVNKGLIQTEKLITGEVIRVYPEQGLIHLQTFQGNEMKLELAPSAPVMINNNPKTITDLEKGAKVALVCRWNGFEKNRPGTLKAYIVMDGRSFVIRNLALEYGGLLSDGRVLKVEPDKKIMTVSLRKGASFKARYNKETHWLPATSRIRNTVDFTGFRVLIFGPSNGKGRGTARMVLNELGVVSMFELMARKGRFVRPTLILASGPVEGIGKNHLTVKRGGETVKIFTPSRTVFVRNNRKINRSDLIPGEQVLIKGTMGRHPVASEVICR